MKLFQNFGPKKSSQTFRAIMILMIIFVFYVKVGKGTNKSTTIPDISKIQDEDYNPLSNKRKREDQSYEDYDSDTNGGPKKKNELEVQELVKENPSELFKKKASMLLTGKQYYSILKIIMEQSFITKKKDIFDFIISYLFEKFDFIGIPDSETLNSKIPKNINALYFRASPEFDQKYADPQLIKFCSFDPTNSLSEYTQYLFLDLSGTNAIQRLKMSGDKKYYLFLPPSISTFWVDGSTIKYLDFFSEAPSENSNLSLTFENISNFQLTSEYHRLPKLINRIIFKNVEIQSMEFQPDTEISELKIHYSSDYKFSDSKINWSNIVLPSKVKKFSIRVPNNQANIVSFLSGIQKIKNFQNVESGFSLITKFELEETNK